VSERVTGGERIWVVEDDPPVRDALRERLICQGYSVRTFLDGQCAWEAYQEGVIRKGSLPDVVITDKDMRRMNGCELAQKIYDKGENTPVVLLTGNPDGVRKNDKKYFVEILSKSAKGEVILKTIENVLEARQPPLDTYTQHS